MKPERDKPDAAVKTLRKALDFLRVVGASSVPLSTAKAAEAAGVSRPTAHRLVQTLIAEGFLEQGSTGRLSVGYGVLPLAAAHLDTNRLRVEAMPLLTALAQEVGERVNLGIIYRGEVLYLAGVEKPTLPTIYSRFGKTAPVHCCSIGKVMLAYMPDEEAASLLPDTLERQTEKTIVELDQLQADFELTRKRGYAIDSEEHQRGTFCLAAPIFNADRYPIAAISMSGRDLQQMQERVDKLIYAAEVISHYMA